MNDEKVMKLNCVRQAATSGERGYAEHQSQKQCIHQQLHAQPADFDRNSASI